MDPALLRVNLHKEKGGLIHSCRETLKGKRLVITSVMRLLFIPLSLKWVSFPVHVLLCLRAERTTCGPRCPCPKLTFQVSSSKYDPHIHLEAIPLWMPPGTHLSQRRDVKSLQCFAPMHPWFPSWDHQTVVEVVVHWGALAPSQCFWGKWKAPREP